MSASYRALSRLPSSIFSNLKKDDDDDDGSLQSQICQRLSKHSTSITNVGQLLQTPIPTLVSIVDPLLTYGSFSLIFFKISFLFIYLFI